MNARPLRVLLLGDFSANLDEGFKNTSHYLATELAKRVQVIPVNVKRWTQPATWQPLLTAQADIIHLISQPTELSLLVARGLRWRIGRARTVVSALQSERFLRNGVIPPGRARTLRCLKPDLFLIQNRATEQLFRAAGCAVEHVPNGVDLARFAPVSADARAELRRRHGLSVTSRVVLHVGHLEADRNLLALAPLVAPGLEVVVAGSTYMGRHSALIESLQQAGIRVLEGYQPQVQELYQLADCYVFPPRPGHSLTMPLSVLEAMACDLPIVTTPFAGLCEAFSDHPGVTFTDLSDTGLVADVRRALSSPRAPQTRAAVMSYSWSAVSARLIDLYQQVRQP